MDVDRGQFVGRDLYVVMHLDEFAPVGWRPAIDLPPLNGTTSRENLVASKPK